MVSDLSSGRTGGSKSDERLVEPFGASNERIVSSGALHRSLRPAIHVTPIGLPDVVQSHMMLSQRINGLRG